MTREFLLQKKIAFTEKGVVQDPQNLDELVQKTGRKATPTILIGDQVVVGFDKPEIEKALKKIGLA